MQSQEMWYFKDQEGDFKVPWYPSLDDTVVARLQGKQEIQWNIDLIFHYKLSLVTQNTIAMKYCYLIERVIRQCVINE